MEKEIEEIVTAEEDMDKNDPENNNKEENREFYVYKHIRKDNNTCFYVGKGKGRRIYKPKRNKHYNRIRKKYGCYVVKIKENLTEKEAFALEREIIEDYVFVFGYGINIKGYYKGYNENERLTNCTWGGEGATGYKHSEEAKQKIGEKNKVKNKGKKRSEEYKRKSSESRKGTIPWNKGKKASDESKRKMSEAKAKNKKAVMCITTGKTFDSMKEASDHYKVAKSNIIKCCKGKLKHAGKLPDGTKLQWRYVENDDNCLEEYKLNIGDPRSKKVMCITTGKTFDSMKEASDNYNVARSSISLCCIGKQKHAGELDGVRLQWKYAEDDDNESKAV